jgi:AICAR transformylase/IMP cyclohydrolase PurH
VTGGPEHDDHLADALAAVECVRRDDTEGLTAVLRHCNACGVTVTLAKLFAVVMNEHDVPPDSFRDWAHRAVTRP